ncbi:DUF4762 family protein [Dryocola clanedunensis]
MKKLNMTEAAAVVGGTSCIDSYELAIVAGQQGCYAVKTCTDKTGKVYKKYDAAAVNFCKQAG